MPGNILIVDDKSANLKLLKSIIEKQGHSSRGVLNGQLAIRETHRQRPDLILLDISMPGMDGFEVCQKLKADRYTQEIPIIFVSASTDLEGKVKGFELGAIDYISKPFFEAEVIARVNAHLNIGFFQSELKRLNENLERQVNERTSQLLETELRFRAIVENSPHPISLKDVEGCYLLVNSHFEDLAGIASADITGKTSDQIFETNFAQSGIEHDREVVKSKRASERDERFETGESVLNLLTTKFPVFGNEGEVIAVGGMHVDITDRKNMEEDLCNALVDAERANEAKSEFLASMSHELRTPLNAVLGFAQMMQIDSKTLLSPVQKECVESILSGGNHLLVLINKILDLARIEANQLDFSHEEVNASEVIANCVAITSPLGKPRGIEIVDQFSDGSPTCIFSDPLRLKQVLLNLLSNAIKFNKDGGTVTVDGGETDGGYLRISISDTGIGIAEKDLTNVFHMFHRLGADPMVAREGTGIGLTVTKLLVEQMAGLVGVESKEGIGSTFWIELPLVSNKDVFIWTDALSTGVDALNKDHQTILALVNKAGRLPVGDGDLDGIIEELIDYTHYHFRREEAVMEACHYPDLEKHRGLHQGLAAEVNELTDEWRKDRDPEITNRLRKFLHDWLIDHIAKVDTKILPYTKRKGRDIQKALDSLE